MCMLPIVSSAADFFYVGDNKNRHLYYHLFHVT